MGRSWERSSQGDLSPLRTRHAKAEASAFHQAAASGQEQRLKKQICT